MNHCEYSTKTFYEKNHNLIPNSISFARRRGKFENPEPRMELTVTKTPYFKNVARKIFWHSGIGKILGTFASEENPIVILPEEEEEKAILLRNLRK